LDFTTRETEFEFDSPADWASAAGRTPGGTAGDVADGGVARRILRRRTPPGVVQRTVSPTRHPISAAPIGARTEIRRASILARSGNVMV
jgi:hypothetical protein